MTEPERFAIRDVTIWDAPWLLKITGDPEATRYLGFRTHTSVRQAEELIELYGSNPSMKAIAVVDRAAPGELLGVIMWEVQGHIATVAILANIHDRRAAGIGRLVCAPFVATLLRQPAIWRVWSYVHVDNVASQRVTERSGAVQEGVMRRYAICPNISDEPQDHYLYAITK
jgi:ribosomal-protein-alanine N-acetyltransferase